MAASRSSKPKTITARSPNRAVKAYIYSTLIPACAKILQQFDQPAGLVADLDRQHLLDFNRDSGRFEHFASAARIGER